MKKRTILSVVIAAIVFSIVAFNIQKEVKAENEGAIIDATIIVSNLNTGANATVVGLNNDNGLYYIFERGKKPPQWRQNVPSGDYTIHICSDYNYGKLTEHITIDKTDAIHPIEIFPICPSWGN